MQPGVPAEAGSAKAVTQRQASQRQAAERPLPLPGSGADAFVRCRRGPKVRKAGANAPSLPVGSEGPKGGHQCYVRCRRNPSVRGPAGDCPIREGPCGKVPLQERPSPEALMRERYVNVLRRERPCGRVLAGAPVREGSRESARAGGFPRKRPCGRVPAKAPRKVPRKAPRVCPGSYCFGFGCAGRWLSSSSAASSAR